MEQKNKSRRIQVGFVFTAFIVNFLEFFIATQNELQRRNEVERFGVDSHTQKSGKYPSFSSLIPLQPLLLLNVSQLAYNKRLMFVLLNSSNVLRRVLSNVIMIDIGYIIITIYMYEMYCVTYHTHDYSLRLILLYSH